jgi:hypothetical protein
MVHRADFAAFLVVKELGEAAGFNHGEWEKAEIAK